MTSLMEIQVFELPLRVFLILFGIFVATVQITHWVLEGKKEFERGVREVEGDE